MYIICCAVYLRSRKLNEAPPGERPADAIPLVMLRIIAFFVYHSATLYLNMPIVTCGTFAVNWGALVQSATVASHYPIGTRSTQP